MSSAGAAALPAQLLREPAPTAHWTQQLGFREHAILFASLAGLGLLIPPSYLALIALTVGGVYVVGCVPTTRNKRLILAVLVMLGFAVLSHLITRPRLAHIIWGGLGLEAFLVLRAVDWAVSRRPDTFSGRTSDRIARFLLYLFYFPTLFAGPVESYVDFYRSYRPFRDEWVRRVALASLKILWGAVKYFVIANYVHKAAFGLKSLAEAGPSPFALDQRILLWGFVFLSLAWTYAQFSGFCDMGVGVSRILGFQVRDNFDRPLLATNPPRYWRSWNTSTYRFLMAHVFYPYFRHHQLGRKIMAVFIVSGLWHLAFVRNPSLDAAIQLLLAVSVYGIVVLSTLRLGSSGVARTLDSWSRTPAKPLVRGMQWALTLTFIALVHRVFWAGMGGQPLASSIELFRRLFGVVSL